MNLKKIIIFYPSFERGGVELILINLINFFLKNKIKIILISSNFNNKKIIRNKYFEIKNFSNKINKIIPNRVAKALLASKFLAKELKKSNPKNTIVFSLQSSSISILLSRIFKFKIVVRNAEDPLYSTFYAENRIFSIFILILKFLTYSFASGIITNSNGSKKSIKKLIFFKKNIKYIYNPYLKKILKNIKFKKNNYILSIGRFTKQKNFEGLIKSFKYLQKNIDNYKLILVGDGELKKRMIMLVNNLDLNKKVKFISWTNDIDKYYKKSKIFILNSVYEGLGNVLIDAVNYNIPIITTNCKSGPSEIIDYGKGGFLVPVKSNIELSNKIEFVIKNNKIAQKKVIFAKNRINRFLCERNSEQYLNFLKKIFNER